MGTGGFDEDDEDEEDEDEDDEAEVVVVAEIGALSEEGTLLFRSPVVLSMESGWISSQSGSPGRWPERWMRSIARAVAEVTM